MTGCRQLIVSHVTVQIVSDSLYTLAMPERFNSSLNLFGTVQLFMQLNIQHEKHDDT